MAFYPACEIIERLQKHSWKSVSPWSLRTTLTEEDIASCSRAFRKPKNAEEERKLIENGTPKSTEKIFVEKIFLEWLNGR